MDIQEFTTYNDNSPVTGFGVWLVLERTGKKVHLFHPVYFSEIIVTEYDFRCGAGATLWPVNASGVGFNAERFSKSFKNRIAFFLDNGRSFPINTVAKALAEMEEISLDEAMSYIGKLSVNELGESISRISNKTYRVYQVLDQKKALKLGGRPSTIVKDILENGPASIYQLTSRIEGKLTTKTELGRVVTYFVNKLVSQGILEVVS